MLSPCHELAECRRIKHDGEHGDLAAHDRKQFSDIARIAVSLGREQIVVHERECLVSLYDQLLDVRALNESEKPARGFDIRVLPFWD